MGRRGGKEAGGGLPKNAKGSYVFLLQAEGEDCKRGERGR